MSAFPTGPCAFPNPSPTITQSTADPLTTLGLMTLGSSAALLVLFVLGGLGLPIGRRRRKRSTGETSNTRLDMLTSFVNGTVLVFERNPEMIGSLINGTMSTIQSFPQYHKK